MKKTICGKLYDTELATVVKKVTVGELGDPAGYEETLYQTEGGLFFLYVAGGEASPYPAEDIRRMSKVNAQKWVAEHN